MPKKPDAKVRSAEAMHLNASRPPGTPYLIGGPHFQFLGKQAPITVWTTDKDLRLTFVWGSLHFIPQQWMGKGLRKFLGPNKSVTPHLSEYFKALQGATVNLYIDHSQRSFHITLAPLRESTGIVGVIGVAMDVTEQRRLESEIRFHADHDPLTQLLNYRVLLTNLDSELRRSDRTDRSFSVMLIDVDSLKAINDRYGHLVGSKVLCRLADTLKRNRRSLDTAARYGGDEFAILLPEAGRAAAECVARRTIESLANDLETPSFTASIGIAVFPEDGYTAENLLSAADRDLYRNKLRSGLQGKKGDARAQKDATPAGSERRRSERRVLDVPVIVSGESVQQTSFREQTFTLSVSAHGALVVLAAGVTLGQKLVLRNLQSEEEAEARVVRFGPPYGGFTQVGVEFTRPAEMFWPN